MSWTTF